MIFMILFYRKLERIFMTNITGQEKNISKKRFPRYILSNIRSFIILRKREEVDGSTIKKI